MKYFQISHLELTQQACKMFNNSSDAIDVYNSVCNINETYNCSRGTYANDLDFLWRQLLSPEFLEIVPDHWLQYPPPSRSVHYILGVIYLLILIPGISANFLIIWLFAKRKSLRTPSNIIVLNLAISDLLMNSKIPMFIYNSFSTRPATGVWGCQIYGFVGGLSGTLAILTITAMAIERYRIISRPLDPDVKMTRAKAGRTLAFIWSYTLSFCLPPFFGLNRYVPEGYLTSCTFDYLDEKWLNRGFVFVFFIAAWCIPVIVICWCYIGILVVVKRHENMFAKQVRKMGNKTNELKKRSVEIKLAKIAFCLITLWLMAWTPYAIVALIGIFFNKSYLTPLASMVPALFCKTASILDPFVYGLTHPKFKSEFKKLVNASFHCKNLNIAERRSTIRSDTSNSFEMDLNPESTDNLAVSNVGMDLISESTENLSSIEENDELPQSTSNSVIGNTEIVSQSTDNLSASHTNLNLVPEGSCNLTVSDEGLDLISRSTDKFISEEMELGPKGSDNFVDGHKGIHVSNESQLEIIKMSVLLIPQVCNIEEKDNKIKIKFRRSI